jgi:hypothetical protein
MATKIPARKKFLHKQIKIFAILLDYSSTYNHE